jgi:hypothetical protein
LINGTVSFIGYIIAGITGSVIVLFISIVLLVISIIILSKTKGTRIKNLTIDEIEALEGEKL